MNLIRLNSLKHLAAAAAILLVAHVAVAHEGHDDAPETAPGVAGAPRLAVHSDLFELVAVVEHGAMTLYLDRYASNEPVTDAKIEVESGKERGMATPNADGSYTFASKVLATPKSGSFTFTVIAGKDSDLLAGDLVVAGAQAEQAQAGWFNRTRVLWGAGIAALLTAMIGAALLLRRRHRKPGY